MNKKIGVFDAYIRSEEEKFAFEEESALARVALMLAEVLATKGMTQRELATRIGVTEGRISQILSADSNPTVRTLSRIGTALGCPLHVNFEAPTVAICNVVAWPVFFISRWEAANDAGEMRAGPDPLAANAA